MSRATIEREALERPVIDYATGDYIVTESDSSVAEAARMMREKKHDCVIITESGKPVGMLTLKDVVYKVVAEGKDPRKVKVRELISRPLITVDPETKLGDAIRIMFREDIRRLPVVKADKILGVIILREVVGDMVEKSITLPDLEVSEGLKCPYCGSIFKTREELSKHIDRVHIGVGVLEGVSARRE